MLRPLATPTDNRFAFCYKKRLFEFNKTPFGFKNFPTAFIRFVNQIFQDLINNDVMQLYMDDIVVYASTGDSNAVRVKD